MCSSIHLHLHPSSTAVKRSSQPLTPLLWLDQSPFFNIRLYLQISRRVLSCRVRAPQGVERQFCVLSVFVKVKISSYCTCPGCSPPPAQYQRNSYCCCPLIWFITFLFSTGERYITTLSLLQIHVCVLKISATTITWENSHEGEESWVS